MLITNATIVTWEKANRVLENHAVQIEGDRITAVGPSAQLVERYPQDEQIDARGQLLMPGNICAHTHFYGAYSRGMGIPGAPPKDFPEILEHLWWPLDKSLEAEDIYYSAMVCLVNAVRHGTTTLIDHHASPHAIPGSLDILARAVEEAGLRAALCYEVTDRDGLEKARAGIDENVRFIRRVKDEPTLSAWLGATFGLHAGLTLSDATLAACAEAVQGLDVGFHVHVAEHSVDEYDSLARTGMRVVDRLAKQGILGPKTIVVHAVHVDAQEIHLLAESDTWVSHQPRSNMNNAVGLPLVEDMLRAGVRVCLGNDGFSNAMWEEWKAAYLAHKLIHRDPRRLPADRLAEMAIYNNAALANTVIPGAPPLGVIAPGAAADLILVDYHPFTPLTEGNLPWHIVFGFHESMITTTIARGQVLMRDRQLLLLDEAKIAAEARRRAPQVWKKYNSEVSKILDNEGG